jgi:type I restriction enzyme S subunit
MTRGFPQVNDVVMTTEAPLGEVALIKDDSMALAQRIITMRGKSGICDNIFLKYYLQSKEGQGALQARASGSTVEGIKASELREMEIFLPNIEVQEEIGSILLSIDDKIDLLHRQNATLEALAETLFRQWFVEEAEENWEKGRLGDFVETNKLTVGKGYKYEYIEYLDTSSLNKGSIDSTQSLTLIDAPSRARRLVRHNDILISTVRPDQRHYGIIKNPLKNLVASTGFCVITCIDIDPHFTYLLLTNDEMTQYLHSIAEGSTSTYPSLRPDDIEKIEFAIPPLEKMNEFGRVVSRFWEKIYKNQIQIRTLTQLRDTLLPKLMSGEVRVSETLNQA